MKKSINRNYFWAELFVNQLSKFGINRVCISPGSRNTPLTLAFGKNKQFKKFIIVDERSSGFFALGLAKKTNKPVALVTTSGTAVSELYSAIIEADLQHIPLVVCTADRPEYLRNTGANQTINQDNIYSNHIKHFTDFGLPNLKKQSLGVLIKKIEKALLIAMHKNPGPVHFNFPFKKPLEPNTSTDYITFSLKDFLVNKKDFSDKANISKTVLNELVNNLINSKRPLLHVAWGNFTEDFNRNLLKLVNKYKIPVLTDGTSELRFVKGKNNLVISNHSVFIDLIKNQPDLIIQFGNAPTTQRMLKYFEITKAKRYLINQFGDLQDPSKKKGSLVQINPKEFTSKLLELKLPEFTNWSNYISNINQLCEKVKDNVISNSRFGLEPRIIKETLKHIPDGANIFISNSIPVRDFDYFAKCKKSGYKIYTNRGASGIDGIISTASGIASGSNNNTYLIIGDLAFYHNLTALSNLVEFKIPLKIILINNNGGGIFYSLPVVNEKNFDKYFITPQNLNFGKIVKAFGGNYYNPKSWIEFNHYLVKTKYDSDFSVIELKTDAKKSVELRNNYWEKIKKQINSLNENNI